MSESMVERAGRALVDAPMAGPLRPDQTLRSLLMKNPEIGFTGAEVDMIGAYLARAAIEAMMEPTDEMVDAMQEARNQQAHTVRDLAVMPWKAGITASLGKGD